MPDDNATPPQPLPNPITPYQDPGRRDVDWNRDTLAAATQAAEVTQ